MIIYLDPSSQIEEWIHDNTSFDELIEVLLIPAMAGYAARPPELQPQGAQIKSGLWTLTIKPAELFSSIIKLVNGLSEFMRDEITFSLKKITIFSVILSLRLFSMARQQVNAQINYDRSG